MDEPKAHAVGGETLPLILVVSEAIEYIKNQVLDRLVRSGKIRNFFLNQHELLHSASL